MHFSITKKYVPDTSWHHVGGPKKFGLTFTYDIYACGRGNILIQIG